MSQRTIYILYNADSTILGKLRYGYRKISGSGPEPACAACDITHGGLSLSESPKWVEAKKEIEGSGIKVIQWHRDEVSKSVEDYVKTNGIRYPTVLLGEGDSSFTSIMTNQDLNACAGDPKALVEELQKKEIISNKKEGASSL